MRMGESISRSSLTARLRDFRHEQLCGWMRPREAHAHRLLQRKPAGMTSPCYKAGGSGPGLFWAIARGRHGWIMRRQSSTSFQNASGLTLIVRYSVGTDRYINRTEAARFPDELDIPKRKVVNVGPVSVPGALSSVKGFRCQLGRNPASTASKPK